MSRYFILSLVLLIFSTFSVHAETPSGTPVFGAKSFTLKNGLQVIVIENNRAPIVNHMLWIRAGAADEPESVGGVAHFLEHLMFKGTKKYGPGDYSRRLREIGGQDNAFTTQDYTSYFALVPREHLEFLMEMERDRFLHLNPPKDHIESEQKVILEERKQRTENDPLGPFYEQINATLFASTPYDNPVIGWEKDIQNLTKQDIETFKKTWYVPNNMVLILSGAITESDARRLADLYYGDWTAQPVPPRRRLSPPRHQGTATFTFSSPDIKQPQVLLAWRMPSYRQDPKTSLSLQVMAEVLGGGASTPLYQNIVVRDKQATGISLSYNPDSWDETVLWFSGTPATNIPPETLAQDMIKAFQTAGTAITEDQLFRAKTKIKRSAVFARDSLSSPAMVIGQSLATGSTLEQVENWVNEIESVTKEDIQHILNTLIFCDNNLNSLCAPPLTALIFPKTEKQHPNSQKATP